MLKLNVNGKDFVVDDAADDTPLLWVLRDHLKLVGTKYGCGIAQCGACTVHMNGLPTRSCQVPVADAQGQKITTVEGLANADGTLGALQQAWIDHDVAQCGYCQAGQLMSATALLKKNPKPTDEDIDREMAGNLCRCATYIRIRKAIHAAAGQLSNSVSHQGGAQ
jgi:isoquinoline 1-oxidoreductase subunit alpha